MNELIKKQAESPQTSISSGFFAHFIKKYLLLLCYNNKWQEDYQNKCY